MRALLAGWLFAASVAGEEPNPGAMWLLKDRRLSRTLSNTPAVVDDVLEDVFYIHKSTPAAAQAVLASVNVHGKYFLLQQAAQRAFVANMSKWICEPGGSSAPGNSEDKYYSRLNSQLKLVRAAINRHVHAAFYFKMTCSRVFGNALNEDYFDSQSESTYCLSLILGHEPYNLAEGFYVVNMTNHLLRTGPAFCDIDAARREAIRQQWAAELEVVMTYHRSSPYSFEELSQAALDIQCRGPLCPGFNASCNQDCLYKNYCDAIEEAVLPENQCDITDINQLINAFDYNTRFMLVIIVEHEIRLLNSIGCYSDDQEGGYKPWEADEGTLPWSSANSTGRHDRNLSKAPQKREYSLDDKNYADERRRQQILADLQNNLPPHEWLNEWKHYWPATEQGEQGTLYVRLGLQTVYHKLLPMCTNPYNSVEQSRESPSCPGAFVLRKGLEAVYDIATSTETCNGGAECRVAAAAVDAYNALLNLITTMRHRMTMLHHGKMLNGQLWMEMSCTTHTELVTAVGKVVKMLPDVVRALKASKSRLSPTCVIGNHAREPFFNLLHDTGAAGIIKANVDENGRKKGPGGP